jgi:hypothetical protein
VQHSLSPQSVHAWAANKQGLSLLDRLTEAGFSITITHQYQSALQGYITHQRDFRCEECYTTSRNVDAMPSIHSDSSSPAESFFILWSDGCLCIHQGAQTYTLDYLEMYQAVTSAQPASERCA